MRTWLRMEQETLRIATEVRLKEANAIAGAFAAGQLTEDQAYERMAAYGSRWPAAATDHETQLRIDDAVQDSIVGPPHRPWEEFHAEQDRRHAALVEQFKMEEEAIGREG
jgi:hypothetical protein